ncbi:MAG TPA: Gfo/Idh/MocA family oxidoreductase [Capillimicrobium sp.]|nr:Gfo/Idh/MocA family oxidoreductase [Capillimicrobium sp.]
MSGRIGVVGLRRGAVLAQWCERAGLEVAIACDTDPARRDAVPHARFTDRWEDLLDARLDGVVLANDFDEHAPLAIAFLERGVHVLSETAACAGEAEGRALVAAADASPATYSFAENYVAHPHVRELARLVAGGAVGVPQLVECEYLHGLSPDGLEQLLGPPGHWRCRVDPTAYCTHTASPAIALAGALPVEVTALAVDPGERPLAVVLALRMATGALAVTKHGFLQGEHDSHYCWASVRGTRALAESRRATGDAAWTVRLREEAWVAGAPHPREVEHVPPPLVLDGARVAREHEGEARIAAAFAATVTAGAPPLVGVREAVAASLVGVAGARSLAEGGRPVAVPAL